jgi:hypothetical protein
MLATFFQEGGWGMWPILVFGLVLLVSAGRYAWDLEPARLRFSLAMFALITVVTAHATVSDLAAVCHALHDPARVPDDALTRTLYEGLMESTRPALLAFATMSLAMVFVTIGVYRRGARELRASA